MQNGIHVPTRKFITSIAATLPVHLYTKKKSIHDLILFVLYFRKWYATTSNVSIEMLRAVMRYSMLEHKVKWKPRGNRYREKEGWKKKYMERK